MGVIDSLAPFDSEIIGTTNAKIINNLTMDIVNNSYGKPEIAMSEEVFRDLKLAKKQNYEVIYLKEGMVDDAENLVEEMFEEMYARLLADLLEERRESPIFQHHVRRLAAASRSDRARGVPGRRAEPDRGGLHGLHDRQLLHGHLPPPVPDKPPQDPNPRLLF